MAKKKQQTTSRKDKVTTSLAIAYNELMRRGVVEHLAEDLRGEAIPTQVLDHERYLGEKGAARSDESEKRSEAGAVFEKTARLLTRLRQGIHSAYDDPEDPRIAGYGSLGVGPTNDENLQRLNHLAGFIGPKLESGEIALVEELRPAALQAHAARHGTQKTGTASAATERQVRSKSLAEARALSARTLQRIKNFVKSYYGAEALTAFGFDLPAPPVRPRLTGVPTDTEPLPETPTE